MTLEGLLKKHKPMCSKTSRRRKRQLNTKRFPSEMWFERECSKRGVFGYERNACIKQRFFADFFFKELKLIIEIDGSSHFGKADYDQSRDKLLTLLGFKVVRVRFNNFFDLDNAFKIILELYDLKKIPRPILEKSKLKLKKLHIKNNNIRLQLYEAKRLEYNRLINKKKAIIRKSGCADKVILLNAKQG